MINAGDATSLEARLCAVVDRILGPDGTAFADGTRRYLPQQHEFALYTARGLARTDPEQRRTAITALEAGTGTGKTLGFLVPLLAWSALTGQRGVVSTATRQLQAQIERRDGPLAVSLVAAATHNVLKISRRVGRDNFASISSVLMLRAGLERREGPTEAVTLLDDLASWLEQESSSGITEDFLHERGLGSDAFGFPLSRLSLSETEVSEKLAAHIAASKSADVLLVNHALLSLHALRWHALLDDPDHPATALVVDEAEHLPKMAENLCRADLPIHRITALLTACEKHLDVGPLRRAWLALEKTVGTLRISGAFVEMSSNDPRLADVAAGLSQVVNVAAPIRKAALRLIKQQPNAETLASLVDTIDDIGEVAESVAGGNGAAFVSFSPVRDYPSLITGRSNPSFLSRLWQQESPRYADDGDPPILRFRAAIITSATLSAPGRPVETAFLPTLLAAGIIPFCRGGSATAGYVAAKPPVRPGAGGVGEPIHYLNLDLFRQWQPQQFGKMDFVLADPACHSPRMKDDGAEEAQSSPEWLDYCARMIACASASGGRTLALTLSFRDTAALAARLGQEAIAHHAGEKLSGLLERYRQTENAILITPGGWEGVDLPGLVQQLVITRIPFPSPASVSVQMTRQDLLKRTRKSAAMVESIVSGQLIDAASRKLRQGFGRGIRAPDDACTVWIADPRFPHPASLRGSLHPLLLNGIRHRRNDVFRQAIPGRFLGHYAKARFFGMDGTLVDVSGKHEVSQ
jgi:ATP-dependent DNA helicase DinG